MKGIGSLLFIEPNGRYRRESVIEGRLPWSALHPLRKFTPKVLPWRYQLLTVRRGRGTKRTIVVI